MDTLNVNGQKCVDLGFVPFNSETFGFTGHLYVTLDSTYFVQKAILNVPKDINLNFVSRMTIEQIFERTSDSIYNSSVRLWKAGLQTSVEITVCHFGKCRLP